jgi:NTP pyrophosphatase (non-canonical NTP hydrolase)
VELNKLVIEAHKNATNKGWHEEKRTFGELIALCHSELSEALEEHRNGKGYTEIYYNCKNEEIKHLGQGGCGICKNCILNKPEGIPVEIADVIIRLFDMCGLYGIDLDNAVKIEMTYNESRPHRHGGKVI